MTKLKLHTPDHTEANIAKLAELFPHCVTETTDDNGDPKRAIDFDLLKQELSSSIVEGTQERYQLNWVGKKEALLTANAPIAKTLRPSRAESVDFDTTQNLYIEGDNLDALKLLQETYLNQVKMIYIDPPYNTGNDFIYEDDFAEDTESYKLRSNQKDEDGNRLVANTESNGRFHSDWLSMMYARLRLARNLLKDDGVIFISIDDNEQANLKRLCDEVFGEQNFICSIMWKRKKEISSDSKNIAIQGEFILSYSRSDEVMFNAEPLSKEYIESSYNEPTEQFPLGKWRPVPITVSKGLSGGGYQYKIETPNGVIHDRLWAYPPKSFKKLLKDNRVYFGKDGNGIPQRIMYAHESSGQPTSNYWDNTATNKEGKKEILNIFTHNYFDTPKPTKLVKRLLNLSTSESDIVLDFFSGSATTAHAVMQLNAEDGGNRKFIMVQIPEPCDEKSEAYKAGFATIAEIGKERIRRAGQKIKTEAIPNLDIGFRVLKIDSSNMNEVYYSPDQTNQHDLLNLVGNIRSDRSDEDLLFQVLLDWGVDLTLPIVEKTIDEKTVFTVADNEIVACFDRQGGITEDFIKQLTASKPKRVVFCDAGFADDSVKINVEQLFKSLSARTEIRTI